MTIVRIGQPRDHPRRTSAGHRSGWRRVIHVAWRAAGARDPGWTVSVVAV